LTGGIDRGGNDDAVRKALNAVPNIEPTEDGASRGVAAVDPRTGEVKGGGSGAGGGDPGEDYDDDHSAGSNSAR